LAHRRISLKIHPVSFWMGSRAGKANGQMTIQTPIEGILVKN
jgi:hypothetical protein